MTYDDLFGALMGGANLAGQIGGIANASNTNAQVQSSLGQNSAAIQEQIKSLQDSYGMSRQAAQQAYESARGQYDTQNAALQGNIGTLTGQLNALSDPNSAYMQNARNIIERKDAAAGRRSQWGDREVQLAGTLADYVGKNAPSLQNAITGAQGQLTNNNNSLSQLYSQMTNAGTAQQVALNQLLAQQQALAVNQATTGHQAAQAQTNNITNGLQSALGIGKGLLGMFGQPASQSLMQGLGTANDYSYDSSGLGSWGNIGNTWNYGGTDANNYLGGGNLFSDYGGTNYGGGDFFSNWNYT